MPRIKVRAGFLVLAVLSACDGDNYVTSRGRVPDPGPIVAIVGSGVPATEVRTVPDFTAVTVTGPLRVVLVPGGSPSLEVTADDNVLPYVRSEVRSDRLFLGFTASMSLTNTRVVLCRVAVGDLRDVGGVGSAVIEMAGIDVDRVSVNLTGASSGRASGTVREMRLLAEGGSRWDAPELRARSVLATIVGASFARQRVSGSLHADVSGGSTLEYLGDPVVTSSVAGASVVRRVGP